MKNSFLYILAILLALSSCSSNEDFNIPNSIIDEEYLEEWGIMEYDRDVSDAKTYRLLEALIDNIIENNASIFFYYGGSINNPPVLTRFNEYIGNNKEAADLFEREDCVSVLLSAYLKSLKDGLHLQATDVLTFAESRFYRLELVLSSEMFQSKMSATEKVQLMVLELERTKHETSIKYGFYMMFSIMQSSNYSPFVNNVEPMLQDATFLKLGWESAQYVFWPYHIEIQNNTGNYLTLDQTIELMRQYAKQFINDNKK